MYNYGELGQVLVFEVYNVTIKLSMMYTDVTKYFDLLLLDKRQRLLARNSSRKLKTATKQTCVYERY